MSIILCISSLVPVAVPRPPHPSVGVGSWQCDRPIGTTSLIGKYIGEMHAMVETIYYCD